MGLIKLSSKHIWEKKHIGTIDYVTKWVKARALETNIIVIIARFIYECIFTRFGCPLTLVIDQKVHFINDVIKHLT